MVSDIVNHLQQQCMLIRVSVNRLINGQEWNKLSGQQQMYIGVNDYFQDKMCISHKFHSNY